MPKPPIMAIVWSTYAMASSMPRKRSQPRGSMLSVYRTLSLRYFSRRWFRALLIVASIALGVGILVATYALDATMSKAALASSNPMAGVVDFMITNGDLRVPISLVRELQSVPGIKDVSPRIYENAKLVLPEPQAG